MKFFNKPISLTSNEFIFHLKRENIIKDKSCYCGRLDPMARGEILVLEGNECKQMKKYLNNDKIYEFIIVFGMSTDTDDIMGLFKNDSSSTNFSLLKQEKIYKEKLKNSIKNILNNSMQKFHKYSSYVLRKEGKRKPLWKWEMNGNLKENEIPSKKIKVYNFEELEKYNADLNILLNKWIENINNVNRRHKFRQNKIIEQYKTLLYQVNEQNKVREENMKVLCVKYKIKASSGFYVRQLICDLKREIEYPILVYDINRINIII